MSPRKSILRHLKRVHEQDPDGFTTPREIAGFDPGDPKHTQAVNQLLKDRLINGVKAPDGGMAIALNTGNLTAVQRALRPWYADPRLWMMAVIVGGLGTAGLLLGG